MSICTSQQSLGSFVLTVISSFLIFKLERYTVVFELVDILIEIVDTKANSFSLGDIGIKQFHLEKENNVLEIVRNFKLNINIDCRQVLRSTNASQSKESCSKM